MSKNYLRETLDYIGRMNNSAELLLVSLKYFYEDKRNVTNLMQIIAGPSQISLRLIDWFITNYCKNIKDPHPHYKRLKGIYQDYRSQLKAYKKLKFDPFRRRQRISFNLDPDGSYTTINTTIGQLNFFKWAIDNGILKYIDQNFDDVEVATNCHQKQIKKKNEQHIESSGVSKHDDICVVTDSMRRLDHSCSTIYFN